MNAFLFVEVIRMKKELGGGFGNFAYTGHFSV
jgi:hypothetical protein